MERINWHSIRFYVSWPLRIFVYKFLIHSKVFSIKLSEANVDVWVRRTSFLFFVYFNHVSAITDYYSNKKEFYDHCEGYSPKEFIEEEMRCA